ncbi:MAG TPA: DUF5615 family PIN-like protein [Anaerolineae bacterium]|nr:DUF5615 family PIN-like protein [Anaerolineae bacterium]
MAAKIKFLMDEHVDVDVTRALRGRGVDVLTVQDVGLTHTDDDRIITLALEQGRVVFTQDADFLRWHQRATPHAGIAYVHRQTPIGRIVRGLLLIYDVLTDEDIRGQIEFL